MYSSSVNKFSVINTFIVQKINFLSWILSVLLRRLIRTRKTPNAVTFHAVLFIWCIKKNIKSACLKGILTLELKSYFIDNSADRQSWIKCWSFSHILAQFPFYREWNESRLLFAECTKVKNLQNFKRISEILGIKDECPEMKISTIVLDNCKK